MDHLSRRGLLVRSGGVAVAVAAPVAGAAETNQPPKLKVLVTGAHPDDPESGCGGTIARYTDSGHGVTALYLTRGEGGIPGKSAQEAAAIRTAEAERACEILKAKPVFAGQVDGQTEVNAARYAEYRKLVAAENPDVCFTHWPLDGHPDHRACALLTFGAWLSLGRKFALYYYEVDLGGETQCFRPTHYVEVSATEKRKRDACFAHASQNPAESFWGKYHEPMLRFRGMECGCKAAEAFVHHGQGPGGRLP